MADTIDIRSDTVTKPTPEMRRAMAEAEVGDDVLGDDPTVRRLEELAATMVGKEAAMLVPSGTMANLAALLAHCQRGEEVILGLESHIFQSEVGGVGALAGLMPRTLPDADGRVQPSAVEQAIRPPNIYMPRTALVCMENTHNRAGGVVVPLADMQAVVAVARRHGLTTHLDGARLFNAAAFLGVSAASLAAPFDSVYICLSKGLGAPVGSILAGDGPLVTRARKYRKMLGGGMRQAGVIAAAGIVALTSMVDRLPEDHRIARRLADGLVDLPGVELDMRRVQTNIVLLAFTGPGVTALAVSAQLRERGILAAASGPTRMRLVANHHVGLPEADRVVAAFREVFASGGRS
ncbi:MAG: GntG family PLP-dependent aldolase [Chloroflexota bacterium]